MEKIYKLITLSKTRLYILCNLVFFVTVFSSCSDQRRPAEITVIKKEGRSVAIFIPSDLVKGINEDNLDEEIFIRIAGKPENILGEYTQNDGGILFTPLIELTPGTDYQIIFQGRLLSGLSIPGRTNVGDVTLLAVYPSADTLPENLLKVYLNFSKPVRQGVSERYLTMLDGKGDTLKDIFLNLNTELWDEEGKQLTIWLDPGRIKRGLQPNEKEGNPLQSGSTYTLVISPEWTDLRGAALDKQHSKKFFTGRKDTQSPNPSTWKMNLPVSGSRQALSISFNESLDHSLLFNTITIIRRAGRPLNGKVSVGANERSLLFYPETPWAAGIYYLKIDSRLEDLAGNNLNRIFDRDLLNDKPAGKNEFHTKQFIIN
ncbi:Ig-like domain-containing protein [Daejeonella sp.]|uniref:Ig-like domain-containing protein n=1 Tax=Daejeonella sp. TaxID=2805397 RepID=UPI0030BDB8A5